MNSQASERPVILIVDDEPAVADNIVYALRTEGFEPAWAATGGQALEFLQEKTPVLMILDIGLPDINGMELCKQLRRTSDLPVNFLTARAEEIDRVVGLEIGGDDYVVKPFSPRELVERVKAILRRSRPVSPAAAAVLTFAGLELDPEKHRVTRDGKPVTLTTWEYKLLHALMRSPGKAFSREELLSQCYRNSEAVIDRVIDVHIGKLRQKIEDDPARPCFILTVRGHGYSFSDDEG